MFERYSENARRTPFFFRYEAQLPEVYDLELTSSEQTVEPSLMRCARRRDSSSRPQRATSPTLSCGEGS